MYGRNLLETATAALALSVCALNASAQPSTFLGPLNLNNFVASTVPSNGDQNPYGVAIVPKSIGNLRAGNILVSNFNNAGDDSNPGGLQGTGSTIVQITPSGAVQLFAAINSETLPGACPGGVGLTTALVVVRHGWVFVGSLPTSDGTSATAQAGCLIMLDAKGNVVATFSGNGINGPWDMTAKDSGDNVALFVTNVLNGDVTSGLPHIVNQGTVLRLNFSVPEYREGVPQLVHTTVIGSGFPETADPAALVVGPTGVGLDADGSLYVADSLDNAIRVIPSALTRTTSAGLGTLDSSGGALNDPLGLAIAPNGNAISANGNDGNLVETITEVVSNNQVAVKNTETGSGSLFGIAVGADHASLYFVDDGNNTLRVLKHSVAK